MMGARAVLKGESGQMTVELAVALPVMIVVAVIAVNALAFISECASFDRSAHDLARTYAASPAYGQGVEQSCALIEQGLRAGMAGRDNMDVSVSYAPTGFGFDEFTATLEYYPSLFGRGLRSEVFGVPLPHLTHATKMTVDMYRPGVAA